MISESAPRTGDPVSRAQPIRLTDHGDAPAPKLAPAKQAVAKPAATDPPGRSRGQPERSAAPRPAAAKRAPTPTASKPTAPKPAAAEAARPTLADLRLAEAMGLADLEGLLAGHADARRIVLVGHDPDFSSIASALSGAAIELSKGALTRIDLPGSRAIAGSGSLRWLIPPGALPG